MPTADEIRRRFDSGASLTIGVEEEIMLLDPVSFDLAPAAGEILAELPGDGRFKPELPAAQMEIATPPRSTMTEVIEDLGRARRELAEACARSATSAGAAVPAVPAVAGVHPFASSKAELSTGVRYDAISRHYAVVARRQMVASLQVHIALGDADRTLAVYNALRLFLPELAALAANAPVYEGSDTGLASVRPTICIQLPRQGIPPFLASWDDLSAELRWGARSGMLPEASLWWWELRPHLRYGTLEVRVPDAQTTVGEAAGVIALVHGLAAKLSDCFDEGELPADVPAWRIQENRWSALRHGLGGTLADLRTGEATPTRERLRELVAWVEPAARRVGAADFLALTRELIDENGAERQLRELTLRRDAGALAGWLAGRFLDGTPAPAG